MERRSLALACLALSLLAAPPSGAEDEIESIRSGPYLGLSAAAALPNFENEHLFEEPVFGSKVEEKTSIAVNARAGWRLLSFLAVEAQYEWVRKWEVETRKTKCATARADVVTANLRLLIPFEAVQPYALAGAGAGRYHTRVAEKVFNDLGNARCQKDPDIDFREENWEFAARFGAGFDVYITRHLLFNLEASTVYSADRLLGEDFPYASIGGGLQIRF